MTHSNLDGFLKTRAGLRYPVRSAHILDDAAIKEFFTHVSAEDLRFRFLSSMPSVSSAQISMLTHPDHQFTESFLVFSPDGQTMLATGMLACDAAFDRGEVAIAIRADHKRHGIGWVLLDHIAHIAQRRGLKTLESVESRENHDAIELERELGFVACAYPGDSTLVLLSRAFGRC